MFKRNKKKILAVLFGLAVLPLFSASAYEQRYTSYVDMPGGSSLVGSARDYSYKNHKITLSPTRIDVAYYDHYGNGYSKVDIGLDKKGLIFWDKNIASGTVLFFDTNTTYELIMGNHGKGKFRYRFFTGTGSNWYGGFRADPVYMYSYE